MSDIGSANKEKATVSIALKEDALRRVLSSSEFAGADRLKEFLTYVVGETIAGRSDRVLGKHIAEDVYGRTSQRESETANVVRVDAGRLRRRLEIYYLSEGSGDPVEIRIEKGGYVPSFHRAERASALEPPAPPKKRPSLSAIMATAASAVFAGAIWWTYQADWSPWNTSVGSEQASVERRILFETSPASLQARNLAQEGRRIMFPATQPARLFASLTLFEKAIELDPQYHGGYAGAAQVAGMFGGLAAPGPQRQEMLVLAREYASEAIRIAPSESWSLSAGAFVAFVDREFEKANRMSRDAVSLEPDNADILVIDAIIAFFSGDFERAQVSASQERGDIQSEHRFPWKTIYGNAAFHLGKYDEAIASLTEAAELGEPVSEISTAHLISALQASGRTDEVRERVRAFEAAWPDSRMVTILSQLFRTEQHASTVISFMHEAGWSSPSPSPG